MRYFLLRHGCGPHAGHKYHGSRRNLGNIDHVGDAPETMSRHGRLRLVAALRTIPRRRWSKGTRETCQMRSGVTWYPRLLGGLCQRGLNALAHVIRGGFVPAAHIDGELHIPAMTLRELGEACTSPTVATTWPGRGQFRKCAPP